MSNLSSIEIPEPNTREATAHARIGPIMFDNDSFHSCLYCFPCSLFSRYSVFVATPLNYVYRTATKAISVSHTAMSSSTKRRARSFLRDFLNTTTISSKRTNNFFNSTRSLGSWYLHSRRCQWDSSTGLHISISLLLTGAKYLQNSERIIKKIGEIIYRRSRYKYWGRYRRNSGTGRAKSAQYWCRVGPWIPHWPHGGPKRLSWNWGRFGFWGQHGSFHFTLFLCKLGAKSPRVRFCNVVKDFKLLVML